MNQKRTVAAIVEAFRQGRTSTRAEHLHALNQLQARLDELGKMRAADNARNEQYQVKQDAVVGEMHRECERLQAENSDMREALAAELAASERLQAEVERLKQPEIDYGELMATGVKRLIAIEADARLGRLVRAMPEGASLVHLFPLNRDQYDNTWIASAVSDKYAMTPEEALIAAGVRIPPEPARTPVRGTSEPTDAQSQETARRESVPEHGGDYTWPRVAEVHATNLASMAEKRANVAEVQDAAVKAARRGEQP